MTQEQAANPPSHRSNNFRNLCMCLCPSVLFLSLQPVNQSASDLAGVPAGCRMWGFWIKASDQWCHRLRFYSSCEIATKDFRIRTVTNVHWNDHLDVCSSSLFLSAVLQQFLRSRPAHIFFFLLVFHAMQIADFDLTSPLSETWFLLLVILQNLRFKSYVLKF